jgi:succinylglutamate desuccinylase
MRIERFGDGEPEVAVVGGIHGDEPCGARAVERLLARSPSFTRPVVFVVANEAALDRSVRFVDEDLNRAFPGDPDGDTLESRLAAELGTVLGECLTLSLHSTQSYGKPFGIVDALDDFARDVAPALSLAALVESGRFKNGRIFEAVPDTLEVECGIQGSDEAADNATRVAGQFLAALDAVDPGSIDVPTPERRPLPVYRLSERIGKDPGKQYEVHVPNFEEVAAGEMYASVDGEPHHAADPFYPVLLSADGYENQFGYGAEYLTTIE